MVEQVCSCEVAGCNTLTPPQSLLGVCVSVMSSTSRSAKVGRSEIGAKNRFTYKAPPCTRQSTTRKPQVTAIMVNTIVYDLTPWVANMSQASESRLYTFASETKEKLRKFRLSTSRSNSPQAIICTHTLGQPSLSADPDHSRRRPDR